MSADPTSLTALDETVLDEKTVLADISAMLRVLLDENGLDDSEIELTTKFHEDLEFESIDLVVLAGELRERYGDKINFATIISERELEEIIALTVGDLVNFVLTSLQDKGVG